MKIHSIILVLLFTSGIFAHGSLDNFKDVVIEKADRTVNAQSQLLKVETRLTFKNERDTLLKEVYLALPTSLKPFLKVFSITEDGSEQNYTVFADLQIQKEYHATLYRIALATPLKSQQSITFTVNEIYWGRMEALPKKIGLTVIYDEDV
jgi:Ribophorin I